MKATSPKKKTQLKKEVKENSFPVVAIGASAGGLEAMMELLTYLPADTGMSFIYVQHLSPDHKSMLTEILSKKTSMIVQEIDDMDKIKPNNVFVIPYNKGIEVTAGHIKLIPRSETSAAISIDILFSSLAEAQKERVIGIILSGSASDGTVGMKAIKQEGGLTFAQDDTAKFTSMPHSAIAAGVVDFVLPPKEIALELARLSKHPLIKTIGVKNGEEDLIDNRNPDLRNILNQLHKATGVDFNAYKMNTVKRRIIRRMLLYKIPILKDYAKLLSQKKEEIDILYQDLLINVTSFFRDTDTHKYLKENLFPKLLKRKRPGESLRIWIPACATGEEAYSIAMMLLEIQENKTINTPVHIFATDLSEQAIGKARIGVYAKQELETVSPKRIQRFFTKANGGFRVNKAVRDMCVFAPHNILQDPPFSRLDFISCCNLFIYLDNAAQKKAVNTFHYALNDDGFLMLGKSENITQSANLFAGFNKKYKIFTRKVNLGARTLPSLAPRYSQQTSPESNISATNKNKTKQTRAGIGAGNHNGLDNAIDGVLVSEFMPACVVINHQMEIVQFRGTTDVFLTHPKGKATFNILKMARPEIAFELRNTISKVIKTKHRARKSGIELKINSAVKLVSFEIVPLKINPMAMGWDEPLLLIIFTEQERGELYPKHGNNKKPTSLAKDRRIKKLEVELAAAHADALAMAQEQEAFNEELQSANEEVVSSNEELQTVNEELETSKEEIESTNEELTTTNQELQTRNDLLNESYDFSEAVIDTMHSPMVVLDKSLRVKLASKIFYSKFKVNEVETEGVLLYDLGNRQWDIPRLRELLENILPKSSYFYDFEITHTFPSIGERIMLLNASRIVQKANHEELILLAFADVTEVRKKALELQRKENEILVIQINEEKNLRKAIEESETRYNGMLMQSPFAFAVLKGKDMVVAMANDGIKQIWDKGNKVEGKPLLEILPELKDQGFPGLLQEVYNTGIPYWANGAFAQVNRKGKVEDGYFDFAYQPYRENDGTISGVVVFAHDVTEQMLARKKIEESDNLFRLALSLTAQTIFKQDTQLRYTWIYNVHPEFVMKEILGKTDSDLLDNDSAEILTTVKQSVLNTGKTFTGDIQIKINGKPLDFTIMIEATKDVAGNIDGIISVSNDITERKQSENRVKESEKRKAFILKLSDALRLLSNPVEIEETVTKMAMDFMGADRCHFSTIEGDNLIILHDACRGDLPSLAGVYPISGFALFKAMLDTDRPFIVEDMYTTNLIDEELKQRCVQLQNISFINIPVIKNNKPVALLSLVQGKPRKWTDSEVQLTIEIAERTWAAVERVKAAEALRKSEETFRTLLNSIDQGFTLCELIRNKEGKGIDLAILEVNPTYEKQTGVTKERVIGKPLLQDFPSLDKWMETYTAVVDNQRSVAFEQYFEETNRWFAIKAYPVEKEKFAVLFSDITERKKSEEILKLSEEHFRTLAELLPQKISQADAAGNVFFYNQNWLSYSGLSIEELKNDGWVKIMHPDERDSIIKGWLHSLKTGSNFEMELRLLSKNGEYKWHLSRATAIKDDSGNIVKWIGAATEIQRQVQQRTQLESEVAKRTNELKQANQELVKLNKELEEFTYVSSHDLQEPVRKIQMFAERILEKESQNLSDIGKEYFHRMRNAAQRMQTLIQDLLVFSRLNNSDRKFEKTDLKKIIDEVIKDFEHTITEKHATIEVKEICEAHIIPFQFRQLLHNVIGNALKFSNPMIPPHIIISAVNMTHNELNLAGRIAQAGVDKSDQVGQIDLTPQKKYCHISISDNGIGFNNEFRNKIFEVFQRLHGSEEYPGTGIGLAIVKKIVDAHSGIITATGKLNKGATFDIYIPTALTVNSGT